MNILNTHNVNDTRDVDGTIVMLRGEYVGSPYTKVEQFGIFYRVGEYKIPGDMDNLLSMHIDDAKNVDLVCSGRDASFYFDSHFQICESMLDDVVRWASMLGYSVQEVVFTIELHQELIDYN